MILFRQNLLKDYYSIAIANNYENNYQIILVRKNILRTKKTIIGSFTINHFPRNNSILVLNDLIINSDFRNKGYCNKLLIIIEKELLKKDAKILMYNTTNINLLKCSLKLKYKITNKYTNLNNVCVYLLTKTLTHA